MKKSFGVLSLAVFSTLILSACGDSKKAESQIHSSFHPAISNTNNLNANNDRVSISTSALGKEFLLQGSLITEDIIPMFQGLQSRVVIFKKSGDQLAMFQSPIGASISKDLEPKYLLATFPIKEMTSNEIIFDFGAGMSQLFVAGEWRAYDFEKAQVGADLSALETPVTYTASVRYSKNNKLVVRQISQVSVPTKSGNMNLPVEAVYYLSPYSDNPDFKKVKSTRYDRMGFFEVAAQLVDGEPTVYATHRDNEKPIVYGISSNTPLEYRQAIKDGILYWNKALGKNLIQVVDASLDMTAPDPDFNIVQWVDWDNAGFAYADAQMDPRTGEILHSQIFMTSAFAFKGKQTAKKLLLNLSNSSAFAKKSNQDIKTSIKEFRERNISKTNKYRIGLRNLTQSQICFRDDTINIQNAMQQLMLSGATNDQILKVSQDYIREVIAHEVGHTLGLRHNFAGSLAANFSMEARKNIFENYLRTGSVTPTLRTSSSVMEYQLFEEGSMTGDLISKIPEALEHDQKSISTLYYGKKYKNEELPLFCTDSSQGSYNDCLTFDSGSSALSFSILEMKQQTNKLINLLASIFVTVKTNAWAKENDFRYEDINVSKGALARYLNAPRFDALASLFYNELPYLQVERQFRKISDENHDEFMAKQKALVASYIAQNKGLYNVMPNFQPEIADYLKKTLLETLSNPKLLSGFVSDGSEVVFSQEEKDSIMKIVNGWLKNFDADGVDDELYYLGMALSLKAPVDGLGDLTQQKLENYLLNKAKIPYIDGEIKSKPGYFLGPKIVKIKLPNFAYSFEARDIALSNFVHMSASGSLEAKEAIVSVKRKLQDLVSLTFGVIDIKDINIADLSGATLDWYTDMNNLLTQISFSDLTTTTNIGN